VVEQIKRRLRWQADDSPYTKLAKLEQTLANYNWAAKEVVPLFAALLSLPPPRRLMPLPTLSRDQDTADELASENLDGTHPRSARSSASLR
jgi:hypothetical protein